MLSAQRASFPKKERMVSRLEIEKLFGGGKTRSVVSFPLRMVYTLKERQQGDMPVSLLVSVSKRHFKHAVDRNRVKRQLREAYRKHKQLLYSSIPDDRQMLIACVWLSDKHEQSAIIEKGFVQLVKRIVEKI